MWRTGVALHSICRTIDENVYPQTYVVTKRRKYGLRKTVRYPELQWLCFWLDMSWKKILCKPFAKSFSHKLTQWKECDNICKYGLCKQLWSKLRKNSFTNLNKHILLIWGKCNTNAALISIVLFAHNNFIATVYAKNILRMIYTELRTALQLKLTLFYQFM